MDRAEQVERIAVYMCQDDGQDWERASEKYQAIYRVDAASWYDGLIAPLLAEARREAAEQAWDECKRAGAFERLVNPYRAEQVRTGDQP